MPRQPRQLRQRGSEGLLRLLQPRILRCRCRCLPANTGPLNPENTPPDSTNPQDLLDRIKTLEQRIRDLESAYRAIRSGNAGQERRKSTSTRTGPRHDAPTPGAKKEVTYQRERVYRRQTINEKIEEALGDAEEHNVKVGVNAGIVAQFAARTTGDPTVGRTITRMNWRLRIFSSRQESRRTRCSLPMSSDLSGPHPELRAQER